MLYNYIEINPRFLRCGDLFTNNHRQLKIGERKIQVQYKLTLEI